MANKRVVLPGFGTKIIPFLLRLFPRGFILAAIRSSSAAKARMIAVGSQAVTRFQSEKIVSPAP